MAQRVPDSLRNATESALVALMDAFRQLDFSQRTAREMVASFEEHLPERAAKSGLLPRFRVLNAEADALVGEYLTTLDRHPFEADTTAQAMTSGQHTYREVTPRLLEKAAALDQFLLDYDVELRRVGDQVRKLDELETAARRALGAAGTAAKSLIDQGFASAEANTLVDRTHAAGQRVAAWDRSQGADALAALVTEVQGLAEELTVLAADYPRRVAKAKTRGASLRTMVETIESRLAAVPGDLAVLRREFSINNWRDLDRTEQLVTERLSTLRARIRSFDQAVTKGEGWDDTLTMLQHLERQVDEADEWVDAPRSRLTQLRRVKADPDEMLGRARFAVRDAQLLVTRNARPGREAVARELDALGRRVDAVRRTLEPVHPDYWKALQEIESIQAGVKQQVEKFRSLPN